MTAISHSALRAAPPSYLRESAHAFWQSDRRNCDFNRETIIPKGSLEIIFNLDETGIEATIGDRGYRIPRCFLSAHHTMPVHVHVPEKQTFFGVLLAPSTLKNIFRTRASEFANQCMDLTLVDASLDSLWHQLMDERSFEGRVETLATWIRKRLPERDSYDRMFDTYLGNKTDTVMSASELSKALCYSPRHLSRKLFELTGMNTEQNLLFRKYLKSLRLMDSATLSLTEIAHASQFTDQSHFIKTFKSFAQVTPGEYRKMKSSIAGHIFENVR
jgi:AraC-like DNA-binding protein